MKNFAAQIREAQAGTSNPTASTEPSDSKLFRYDHLANHSAIGIAFSVPAYSAEDAAAQVQEMFDNLENYPPGAEVTLTLPNGTVIPAAIYFYGDGVRAEDFGEEE